MLGLLLGGIALLLIWRILRNDTQSKLIDKIPGPRRWSVLGTVGHYMRLRDASDVYRDTLLLVKLYPKIYRLWLMWIPFVKLLDYKYIEALLDNTNHLNKSQEYDFTSEWLGRGLLTAPADKWHSRRKLLTPAFHFSILEQFVPVFCDKSRILVEKLRFATKNSPEGVDILPYVLRCALDVVCETTMGTSVNAQDDINSSYVAAIHEVNEVLLRRMFTPWLYPGFIFHLSSYGRRQRKAIKILHGFTNKVIQERKACYKKYETNETQDDVLGVRKKIAFLDILIKMQEKEGFTDEDIREEVETFMFAGHDTTGTSIGWALFFIGCNPQVQNECAKEMESIFNGSSRDPNLSDLNAMKYMERVIKESMRMRPAVWSIGRRTYQDLPLDKYIIPPGVTVSPDIYNVHHNPKVYPDPEKFDPDRFLPDNCVGRHPFAYIPFGAGSRNCIGQKFAMLEMKVTLSFILRHFEFRAVYPERDQCPLPDIILRPRYGVTLKLQQRQL